MGDHGPVRSNISNSAYFFDCFADNVDTINVDQSDCSEEFVSADASTADDIFKNFVLFAI